MAIRVSSFTVDVGVPQQLEIAQGEDREFRLSFQAQSLNMTGATAVVFTVKELDGDEVFARSYTAFHGSASENTPRFTITQSDTASLDEGDYEVDVSWTDASGYKTQLLAASVFKVLKAIGASTDSVTTPASVPVTYGLRWRDGWSALASGPSGYLVNDAVFYPDPDGATGSPASSFRAIAQTNTAPLGSTGVLNSSWEYIAKCGGDGTGNITSLYPVGFPGVNGTGTVSVSTPGDYGPVAGDRMLMVVSALTGGLSVDWQIWTVGFTAISDGTIQQTYTGDLSAINFLALLSR